jgi:hypothetical protein
MNPNRRALKLAIAGTLSSCGLFSLLSFSTIAHAALEDTIASMPVDIPFHLEGGHIYIDLEIDGQGPFHFIFDSGAPNVLTPAAARRLNLSVRANVNAKGTGGSQDGGSTRVNAVRLGNLTLENQTFYVLDLPASASETAQVDGLIGFEWLERFPVRLDYVASKLTFYPARNADYAGRASPTTLYFRGKTPQIDGTVDGIAGRFSLDTGSNGSLTLYAPFVESHGLAARYNAKTKVMSAVGIGGPVYALLARADQLGLGRVSVQRPVTFLSQQTAGTSIRRDTAGNIGFGVLRQFDIVFDYPHARIYFEPNAYWGEPDLADRSGLRVESDSGALRVAFVAENSPGMVVGLKTGDRIVAVNGVPSEKVGLYELRAQLKGPIGTRISIKLDHKDAVVILELRDL